MKTNYFKFIGAFLILIFIIGCNSEEKVKVGISIGPDHERWLKDRDYLVQRLENHGAQVFVLEAGNNERMQSKQVEELVTKDKIDVLIIIPVNSETAGLMVDNAKRTKEGLKVIAYDRMIKNCMLDFYISFDNVKVGELQADYLTRIKSGGKYALLGGDQTDNNSILLRLGQMNVLQPLVTKGDVKIVIDRFVDGWNANLAYQIVDDYLKENKGLDAIVASNDELARGASMALDKYNMSTKVLLSGQDAQIDACKRIIEGKQTMTVYKFIESLAHSAANIAIQLGKNEPMSNSYATVNNGRKLVPSLLLPSMIQVTPENIRMTVIADGYLDEKQVFGN